MSSPRRKRTCYMGGIIESHVLQERLNGKMMSEKRGPTHTTLKCLTWQEKKCVILSCLYFKIFPNYFQVLDYDFFQELLIIFKLLLGTTLIITHCHPLLLKFIIFSNFLLLYVSLQCWESNLGPCACWTNTLSLSCLLSTSYM